MKQRIVMLAPIVVEVEFENVSRIRRELDLSPTTKPQVISFLGEDAARVFIPFPYNEDECILMGYHPTLEPMDLAKTKLEMSLAKTIQSFEIGSELRARYVNLFLELMNSRKDM